MTSIALPRPVTIGGPTSARFPAIGTTHRIHVTNPSCLIEATAIAREELDLLVGAVSRFRPDSEISLLATRAAHGPAWIFASATLSHYLGESLRAARLTDGLVDPTVGAAVMASGYDADLLLVQRRPALTDPGADAVVPGWRHIDLDPATRRLSVPRGCLIDLGASAKAAAADRIAQRLADRLPGGFLVNLGGDIATSGELPDNGWRIGIEAANGSILQVVTGTGQAFATSSTQKRTWATGVGGERRHHIVDPRTGRTATSPWAQVTCAAASGLEANAASTAAIILGDQAPEWLRRNGIPARLDALDGSVTTTPGWPEADQ